MFPFYIILKFDMIDTVESESGKTILIIEHQPPFKLWLKNITGLAKIPDKIPEEKICIFFFF